jgi:hypothetical protein
VRIAALKALKKSAVGDAQIAQQVAAFLLSEDKDEANTAMSTLIEIGPDRAGAQQLMQFTPEDDYYHAYIFKALLSFPDLALAYLPKHYEYINESVAERIIAGWIEAPAEIKAALLAQPNVPINLLAMSLDPVYLPTITAALKQSNIDPSNSPYARMLGVPAKTIINIDATHAGDFRPASAWPNVDRRRMSRKSMGHGDGITDIIVTGRITFADGSSPPSVSFVGINDLMLMGQRVERPERCLYQAETGRFALFSHVFAAYAMGDDTEEKGPYQTGALRLQLSAPGAHQLSLTFYDEMPDVAITLTVKP